MKFDDSHQSALRILDANLNRATEALRVAEDIYRFHWNLPLLARDLKGLRHRLFTILEGAGPHITDALQSRNIEGDVGRANPSPPGASPTLPELARRNLQRAKEAIRTLEEISRACFPRMTSLLETLRYDLYTAEKATGRLSEASHARARMASVHLYLLATTALSRAPLAETVARAIEGGCTAVQLRENDMDDGDLLPLARELRAVTARGGAVFIVNDRPDIARLVHADGVHLGQGDLPVHEARDLLGDDLLIGVSTHDAQQAATAARQGADYIGIGPAFSTDTKPEAGPALGPEKIGSIVAAVTIPTFAIGGINSERVIGLRATGCQGVAVSAAILGASTPADATRAVLENFTGTRPR